MLFLTLVLLLNSVKCQSKIGPECSNTCGNITIHYPFGIEDNCYLDTSYKVSCNKTTGRVSLWGMNVDVVDISLDGHLRAISKVGHVCYNETSAYINKEPTTKLSRFNLSVGQNELTTFGCDILSKVKVNQSVIASCTTVPGECKHMVSCSGKMNCCQDRIENGLPTKFKFRLLSSRNNTGKNGLAGCAYSFIVEIGRYDFSSFDVYKLKRKELGSPEMLLDWTVGNTSCQEAQKNISTYLCKENSECFDSNNAKGYRCSCSAGYGGNPYLGCQGIKL
ncbi:wall-associated receptor kinase 1-like [Bidens hawaiensis]|uniref:wall-associated receptor kinase 1-like n=1 Tax=Bidens hawaiensis TaxID=980011 RepID=UPI00404B8FB4